MNFTDTLGWTLLHFVWQGAAVALLFALAEEALRNGSARARYAAACGAMLLMLGCAAGTFAWLYPGTHSAAARFAPAPAAGPIVTAITAESLTPASAGSSISDYLPLLVYVWFAGVCALAMRSLGGWLVVQRFKRHGSRPLDGVWEERLALLVKRLGIARAVRLRESALAEVPAVIGWLRPVVLVPGSTLTGLSPQQLEALLAHELAHIRRHDYLVNLLQTCVETLLFYHPAVWWVGRRIRAERENCCDDLAVEVCGDALIYARALARLEQLRGGMPQLAMASNRGPLLERIERLLAGRPARETSRSHRGRPGRLTGWHGALPLLLCVAAVWLAPDLAVQNGFSQQVAEPAPAAAPKPVAPAKAPAAASQPVQAAAPAPAPAEAQPVPAVAPAPARAVAQPVPVAAPAPAAPAAVPAPARAVPSPEAQQPAPAPAALPAPPSPLPAPAVRPAPVASAALRQSVPGTIRGSVSGGIRAGIRGGVAGGVTEGVAGGVTAGVVEGVTAGVVEGVTAGVVEGVTDGVVTGVSEGVAGGVADGVISRVSEGVIGSFRERVRAGVLYLAAVAAQGAQAAAEPAQAKPGGFIEGLAAAGYRDLSVDDLIRLKTHGVTPEFARQVQAAGLQPSAEELVKLRIHGVTPEFIAETKGAGLNLTLDQLVKFRIHGVNMAAVKEMKSLGYELTPDQMVKMHIHGLTPALAREAKQLGVGEPDFDQLIKMQIHGVTPEYAAAVKQAGVADLSLERLVKFRIHGVEPDQIREFRELGFTNLSADEVVSLAVHGVTPAFIRAAHKQGFKDLSLDKIIKLKQLGILEEPAFI
jgi:beta-lactamase regulating signal transducer with metallopeptidase domain